MIWLTWRQFRTQALAALVVLAAAAIYLVITGLRMHHAYTADLVSCKAHNECSTSLNALQGTYSSAAQLAQLFLLVAPALIGIFWGAPLISRELEAGTHQLAWNQSVTRTRWLAVKLGGVAAATIVTVGLLSYLLSWWSGPLDQLGGGRFEVTTFDTRDLVPAGYAAFAFALGAAAGLFLRRTVTAMAVTLAVFVGIQILVPTMIRPNLLPSTTVAFPIDQATMSRAEGVYDENGVFHVNGLPAPQGAWILSNSPVEKSTGQTVSISDYGQCFPGPGQAGPGADEPGFDATGACLAPFDLHENITYQPESHYWPLQWYETGIFLALAGVLSGACFWQIRRRQN